jgi:hypothetical protein
MTSNKKLLFCLLIFLLFTFGCGSIKKVAINSQVTTFEDITALFNENNDPQTVKEALPTILVLMDGMVDMSPKNKDLLALAAQAYCAYSLAFVEDEDPKRASKLYIKGRDYGLQALKQKRSFRKALEKPGSDFNAAVEKFGKSWVPALFWTGACWGSYINLNKTDVKTLFDVPKVRALMNRVIEKDEDYFYGGAHLFLGSYYASMPSLMGGGADKANAEFQRAFEISENKFLMHHLFYAKYYAVLIQDQELFEQELQMILDAPNDILPEQRLGTYVTKEKAQVLINNTDDYF